MDPGLLFAIVVLGAAFLVLAYVVVRGAGNIVQLVSFVLLLGVVAALGYIFIVYVVGRNPNPARVAAANWLSKDKLIDLTKVVPGVYDLDYIQRLDADADEFYEWLVFYQYDAHIPEGGAPRGPFGAAIYDLDECRPPAVLSFELAPVNYDYLGEEGANAKVENIVEYYDSLSNNQNRPEVIVTGYSRRVATDLNIFRKTGVAQNCFDRQAWLKDHPGEAFPNPFRYENIGSFRANYSVARAGATVTTFDRAPFERSQITIRRDYRPENGSYFQTDGRTLLAPVEVSLAFGANRPIDNPQDYLPEDIPQVYYPEKAVLAFYLNLTKDKDQLKEANGYLSPDAQAIYNIETDRFGIAMPRDQLARVLVWEIRYEPDLSAERLHEDRNVTVTVVGVDGDGTIDYAHPCQVTWTIVGYENPSARPYGCEWRLETYWSPCAIGK